MRRAMLRAQDIVSVPVGQARGWFLSLREHPDRYRFDTHEGFEFIEGSFGQVGAVFRTREKLLGLKLKILFELTEVRESEFYFLLARPLSLGIWGRFHIGVDDRDRSRLSLEIGSDTRLGRLVLGLYPVAMAIQGQIEREVGHVKRSMEREFAPGNR